MRLGHHLRDLVVLALLSSRTQAIDQPTEALRDSRRPHDAIETGTCEARTVNHVTDTLPPFCLTGSYELGVASATSTTAYSSTASDVSTESLNASDRNDDDVVADAAGPPFMSFEDWKEEMLKRTGQDPQELRSRKPAGAQQSEERILSDDTGLVWGDEEEIALDFGEYAARPHSRDMGDGDPGQRAHEHAQDGAVAYDHNKGSLHRSKDAGKTCKERFSYSSFDAGATILKTGSGTKNPKAILVENKDSYMLLECGRDNKFVIVELSDDILLDTVVIANFEFFSSMIRHFRISVSDRYPVKVDKWKELGTFEARNSRDIQAFLVENPQIWAKYVRLEFLTHYGNEFYCPVSLIRVHGSRMLDSWKETDSHREEELLEDDDREARQCEEHTATTSNAPLIDDSAYKRENQTQDPLATPTSNPMTSMDLFAIFASTCPELPTQLAPRTLASHAEMTGQPEFEATEKPWNRNGADQQPDPSTGNLTTILDGGQLIPITASRNSTAQPTEKLWDGNSTSTSASVATSEDKVDVDGSPKRASHVGHAQKPSPSSSGSLGNKSRGTPTLNAASASPTVQEGFFNSITKRLSQVESNLTLSMKYIEDQSRHVQEAMQRMEHKQTQRITIALEELNTTVLAEMRNLRDQYEQLWHSTILALDSQRDRTEQDAVALSARLNLLADEVVFQKRMAIAQAVLLLSCLFLVIFSRGVSIPYLAHPQQSNEVNALGGSSTINSLLAAQKLVRGPPITTDTHQPHAARLMTPESTHDVDRGDDATFHASVTATGPRHDPRYHTTQARFYRTPSPHAPRIQKQDEFDYHDINEDSAVTRLPASDQQNSRKPLPALPEHPLSP